MVLSVNKQCGGWLYNILPYMEMQGLHDMGQNGDAIHGDIDKDKAAGVKQCICTAVVSYYCPSRGPPLAYYSGGCCYANLTQAGVTQPTVTGQSDYAANCGCSSDVYIWIRHSTAAGYHAQCNAVNNSWIAGGDKSVQPPYGVAPCYNSQDWGDKGGPMVCLGVMFNRSMIRLRDIKDGTWHLPGRREVSVAQ